MLFFVRCDLVNFVRPRLSLALSMSRSAFELLRQRDELFPRSVITSGGATFDEKEGKAANILGECEKRPT